MTDTHADYQEDLTIDVEAIVESIIDYPEDYKNISEAVRAGIESSQRITDSNKRLLTIYHSDQSLERPDYHEPWDSLIDVTDASASDVLFEMAYSVYYSDVMDEVKQRIEEIKEERESIADAITDRVRELEQDSDEFGEIPTIAIAGDITEDINPDGDIVSRHGNVETDDRVYPLYILTPQRFNVKETNDIEVYEIDEDYRKEGNEEVTTISHTNVRAAVVISVEEALDRLQIPEPANKTFEY